MPLVRFKEDHVNAQENILELHNDGSGDFIKATNSNGDLLNIKSTGEIQSSYGIQSGSRGYDLNGRIYLYGGANRYIILGRLRNASYFEGVITLDNYTQPTQFKFGFHTTYNLNATAVSDKHATKYFGSTTYFEIVDYAGETWFALRTTGQVNRGMRFMGIADGIEPFAVPDNLVSNAQSIMTI